MTKAFYAGALALLAITFLMLLAIGPAEAEEEAKPAPTLPGAIRMAARDAFACPGMHAEWLDDKTVQCLKEKP